MTSRIDAPLVPGLSCPREGGGLCCTKIHGLGVTLGRRTILENIDLHIHCGQFTAIIGPNGAGKSTLLKAILGEIRHTGTLEFTKADGKQARSPRTGYVPQTPRFDRGFPISVLDLFVSLSTRYPVWFPVHRSLVRRVEAALDRVSVKHLLHQKIGGLSGGEIQRVLLALALEPVPELLLLDEPDSGIDILGLETFYAVVNEIRRTYDLSVVMVSHDFPLLERFADRIILLDGTVRKVGTPHSVFGSEEYRRTFHVVEPMGGDA